MKYLFLDTNIYLHYTYFEQIEWKSLLKDIDDFTIIVPPQVIREIDKQKDQGKDKIKDRARKISSKFGKLFLDENPQCDVKIQRCDDPSKNNFDGIKLSSSIDDDWIILAAIHSNFEISDIILVSSDINILIKAKESGLRIFKMDEEYKLKEDLSDKDKKIKSLESELRIYKDKSPKPYITFSNDQECLEFVKPTKKNLDDELSKYTIQLKTDHQYQRVNPDPYCILSNSMLYTEEQIKKYNKELDIYFKECIEYKQFRIWNNILDELFKEISFKIHNRGTGQTGDMSINITFLKKINLYNNYSKKNRKKEPPIKPRLGIDEIPYSNSYNDILRPIPQIYCWDLEKKLGKNQFEFQESKLNHSDCSRILNIKDSLYIDIGTCENFEIEWKIVDSNVPKPFTGKLYIKVKECNI